MARKQSTGSAEVREVLVNAIEVELAALKAAVSFWREWAEHTSRYVKTTTQNLSTIRSANKDARQVLLEIVDTSRETMRIMTELPRKAAEGFLHELDAIEQEKPAGPRPAAKRRGRAKA